MARLLSLLAIVAVLAGACSDGDDATAEPTTTTAAPTTAAPTTAPPTTGAPATYCEAVERVNASLDEVARTMLATLAGEPSAAFIVTLEDTVSLLDQASELAPPEAADATTTLADAYAGFEELLFEIDFMVAELPTDDPRAAALSEPAFAEAVATMTEVCA